MDQDRFHHDTLEWSKSKQWSARERPLRSETLDDPGALCASSTTEAAFFTAHGLIHVIDKVLFPNH